MKADSPSSLRTKRIYLKAIDCRVEDLGVLTSQSVALSDYPFAADVQKNVLIYDCNALRTVIAEPEGRKAVMAEWVDALRTGPGVVVLKHAETDHGMLDRASAMFREVFLERLQQRFRLRKAQHFLRYN